MPVFVLMLGLVTGVIINYLADYLPRFAVEPPKETYVQGDWLCSSVVSVCALLFMGLWVVSPGNFPVLAAGCAYLLLIALIDLKYRLVLDVMLYPMIILLLGWHSYHQDLKIAVVGGIFALSIFLAASLLGDLGGGDVKLAGVLGLAFGFPQIIVVLVIGGAVGALVAVSLLISRRASAMPYAPFLCLGALMLLVVY